MKNKMNIAIVGLGNIGSFFYKFINKNKIFLTNKTNVLIITQLSQTSSGGKAKSQLDRGAYGRPKLGCQSPDWRPRYSENFIIFKM